MRRSTTGFPPLTAALMTGRDTPGANMRTDVNEIVELLLAFGCDPNQRGINDYTPLHTAVAERNAFAVQLLLDRGADPDLRTRIDEYETPLEMARSAGLTEIAAILERRGTPVRKRLRSGLTLLVEVPGRGDLVRRQQVYPMRLRFWLNGGEPCDGRCRRAPSAWRGSKTTGATLVTELRIDRRSLVNGLFYGIDGMRVGGMRRLEIAPHLAYGERGVPGIIPANAVLTAEVTILDVTRAVSGSPAQT
jgi:hypothetical protein